MRVFYFPLEQITQRMYSTVYRKMTEAFEKAKVDYEVILPAVNPLQIDSGGCVMSGAGHCQWCLEQMAIFMSKLRSGEVKDGDICYFDDLWFPGLESIFYTQELMNLRIGVYGFLHAGSFTYLDFVYPMRLWARNLEKSWITASSLIFVGSQQTKTDIYDCGLIDDCEHGLDKIVTTGLPFEVPKDLVDKYSEEILHKEDNVIFPHRDDIDKGVDDLLRLILLLKKKTDKPIKYVITSGGRPTRQSTRALFANFPEVEFKPDLSKDEYYKLLAKSKVMFSAAIQENFGVCTQEALAFGVYPVCPDRVSYKYLLHQNFRYCNLDEAAAMVLRGFDQSYTTRKDFDKYCHHPYSAELIVYNILLNERR